MGDWIDKLVGDIMSKVRNGGTLPDALKDAADALHVHRYEDYMQTAYSVSAGRDLRTLRHRCACGDEGVGPADWCARERLHNHKDYTP